MPESFKSDQFFSEPEPIQGKFYFFGIGISQYQIAKPLFSPARDAQAMAEVLTHLYNFEKENCVIMLNETATRKNIINQLRKCSEVLEKEDSLLIFYSGHSYVDDSLGEAFWIPVDGDPKEISDLVSNSEIRLLIESIHCRHILLIQDACISGKFTTRASTGLPSKSNSSRMVLAVGIGHIAVSDGVAGSGSPFTLAIIRALENNDKPSTFDKIFPQIDWGDLLPSSPPFYGPIYGAGHGGGSFPFALRPQEEKKPEEPVTFNTPSTPSTPPANLSAIQRFYADTLIAGAFTTPGDLLSDTANQTAAVGLNTEHIQTLPLDHLSLVVEKEGWEAIEYALKEVR